MTKEERLKILERHVGELSEIYDAVQIVGTWLSPDGCTNGQKRGSGNWYARQAMCREFIEESIQDDLSSKIADKLDPPDDWNKESQSA